jgi:hypothetical protein
VAFACVILALLVLLVTSNAATKARVAVKPDGLAPIVTLSVAPTTALVLVIACMITSLILCRALVMLVSPVQAVIS